MVNPIWSISLFIKFLLLVINKMGDIRLNQITIDSIGSNILTIDQGTITITNTSPSISTVSASLFTFGGISSSCTSDATGSSSGGGLTIKGGMAIGKSSFFNGNITQDSQNKTFTLQGSTYPRFFVDSTSNSDIFFSPNGTDKIMDISSYIHISSSQSSINSTSASLVISGGFSVYNSQNSTSITSGGCATFGGGASFARTLRIGEDLYINGDSTTANMFLGGTTRIASTSNSLNFYTGGLVLSLNTQGNAVFSSTSNSSILTYGGISTVKDASIGGNIEILSTLDVSSPTSGSLYSFGGGSFAKSVNIGVNLSIGSNILTGGIMGIDINATSQNKIVLFQTSGSLVSSTFTGFGVNGINSLTYNIQDTSESHVFYSNSNEILRLFGTGIVKFHGNLQEYILGGNTSIGLALQSTTPATASIFELYTADGDALDDNILQIYGVGSPTSTTNLEYIQLGWDSSLTSYKIKTQNAGSGLIRSIILESGSVNQVLLSTDGSVSIGGEFSTISNATIGNSLYIVSDSTIGNNLLVNSNLNINGTNLTTISLNTRNNLVVSSTSNTGITLQDSYPILSLQNVGTVGSTNSEALSFSSSTAGSIIQSIQTGSGSFRPIFIGSNQLYLETNGNIGINTTSPSTMLYVNGGLYSLTSTIGSLSVSTLIISSTVNSTSVTSGSEIVFGGLGVSKDFNLGGNMSIKSTSDTSFTTLGGISVAKGISTNLLTSGTTILGNSTITSLIITSTANSISVTTGSVFMGGIGVVKDFVLGGSENISGSLNLNGDSLYLQNTSGTTKFSIEKDNVTSNFSISRYNSSGTFIENALTISNTTGNVVFSDSVTIGNTLFVSSTVDSINSTSASLVSLGGFGVAKNGIIGGGLSIQSTTVSSDTSTGSLIVGGGGAFVGNVNIGANLIVGGSFTVLGTPTTINSNTEIIGDNIFVLNSAPSGTRDAGFLVSRYQTNNSVGSGDVVSDNPQSTFSLPDQTTMLSTQVKLPSIASSIDDYYIGWYILVTSGFSSNQVRIITGYVGATRIATVSAWTDQNPAISDTINVYDKPYVGFIFNESSNIFNLVSTTQDPGFSSVVATEYIGLKVDNIILTNTSESINSTSGGLYSAGGISINCTQNATSSTSGGSGTFGGGVAVAKDIIIGGTLTVNGIPISKGVTSITFNAQNNQPTPIDLTGALLDSGLYGVDIFLAIRLTATSNMYANYHLRLVNRTSSWDCIETYVGDDTDIEFSCTSGGQIQYITPNFTGFTSLVFKYTEISN